MMESQFTSALDALEKSDTTLLKQLLSETPGLLKVRGTEGTTLLGLACRAATSEHALPPMPSTESQLKTVRVLLEAGADPSMDDDDGWAPLYSAAMTDNVALASLLLDAGAPLSGRLLKTDGGTPLSIALFYGRDRVAAVLANPPEPENVRTAAALGLPIDPFFKDEKLRADRLVGLDFYRPTAFWPAWSRAGDQDVLDEALTWAARNGMISAMAALVDRGANVNANPFRGTPLLWAIYQDRVEAASWLLDHGANPDLPHDFGGTGHGKGAVAMHLAAQYESLECLKVLLARGANAFVTDEAYGGTPLGWAEHVGATRAAEILRAHLA